MCSLNRVKFKRKKNVFESVFIANLFDNFADNNEKKIPKLLQIILVNDRTELSAVFFPSKKQVLSQVKALNLLIPNDVYLICKLVRMVKQNCANKMDNNLIIWTS